jgi:hypothetical protein
MRARSAHHAIAFQTLNQPQHRAHKSIARGKSVPMEVNFDYQIAAKCQPLDVWKIFADIEQWHRWSPSFGQAAWVRGEHWKPGSRFFIELTLPHAMHLEILVLRCNPASEVVFLCHGDTTTVQLWITFHTDIYGNTVLRTSQAFVGSERLLDSGVQEWINRLNNAWLDAIKLEAERSSTSPVQSEDLKSRSPLGSE